MGALHLALPRLAGKTVVANISGGKDSTALSLWLHECGIEHRRVFADTGWEHPATYEYIRNVLEPKLGPIDWVRGPKQMQDGRRPQSTGGSRHEAHPSPLLAPCHGHALVARAVWLGRLRLRCRACVGCDGLGGEA
jgi:hypothetical protein